VKISAQLSGPSGRVHLGLGPRMDDALAGFISGAHLWGDPMPVGQSRGTLANTQGSTV